MDMARPGASLFVVYEKNYAPGPAVILSGTRMPGPGLFPGGHQNGGPSE